MDRRNFLKNTCGSCAAIGLSSFFLTSILDSCKTPSLSVYKTSYSKGQISVPLSTLTSSDFKLVRVNNYSYDIAIVKQPQDKYVALLLMCTHAGQALTKAGNGYFCPLHGSKFSATGEVVKGPATEPLQHLQINMDNQNLFIKLDSDYYSS